MISQKYCNASKSTIFPKEVLALFGPYSISLECNNRTHYNGNIREGMFCAAAPGKDSCNGDSYWFFRSWILNWFFERPFDSGGATRNSYEILGVKSWGYGCGQASYPGVYTDVALFRKWIDSNINKDWSWKPFFTLEIKIGLYQYKYFVRHVQKLCRVNYSQEHNLCFYLTLLFLYKVESRCTTKSPILDAWNWIFLILVIYYYLDQGFVRSLNVPQ